MPQEGVLGKIPLAAVDQMGWTYGAVWERRVFLMMALGETVHVPLAVLIPWRA